MVVANTGAHPPWLTLVIGGARSGKSRHAEALVTAAPGPWTYIATADAFDDEMAARIADHRARRHGPWTTLDAPLGLPDAIVALPRDGGAVLVDCLTLWLSNLLLADRDLPAAARALVAALETHAARTSRPLVVVSNEVGLGIVPENALARRFRDAQGRLNQEVAAIADQVVLVAAGLPLRLK